MTFPNSISELSKFYLNRQKNIKTHQNLILKNQCLLSYYIDKVNSFWTKTKVERLIEFTNINRSN